MKICPLRLTIFALSERPWQQRSPQATTISSLLPLWPIQISQPCLAEASRQVLAEFNAAIKIIASTEISKTKNSA